MTGGGLGSPGLPLLGRGGAPSGCSPLRRPSHSAATARSPPLPGASLPPGSPALHIPGTVVCTVRATRPQSSTPLLNVARPPGSGPHASAEFDLGQGASWSSPVQGFPSRERGTGAPCCPAAGRRPGLATRAPSSSFSLAPQINTGHRVFQSRVDST